MEVATMTKVLYSVLYFLLFCVSLYQGSDTNDNLTNEPGHLKPFGTGRPVHQIEEISDFPDPKTFFNDYFNHHKPVKIKNGAHYTLSYQLWTDEYFLNLDIPEDANPIHSETVKKEDRNQDVKEMDFKELVKIYKNTSYYMVDAVPEYLKKDVVIPFSIQCPVLLDRGFEESIMWLSGGGTSSVVHFDSTENINCVYRGTKDFMMIDPFKYGDQVTLDGGNTGYSLMDVDSVDYLKYPGMAKVEFVSAHLDEGDCLYIPSGWIHQVRSFNINLAVNIWWSNLVSRFLDIDGCNTEFDGNLTLDKAYIEGLYATLIIRDIMIPLLDSQPSKSISADEFISSMYEHYYEWLNTKEAKLTKFVHKYTQLFMDMDKDGDGTLTLKEFFMIPMKMLRKYNKTFLLYEKLVSLHRTTDEVKSEARVSDHTEL